MKRILYIQYANPAAYPPLQHSARLLQQAGWKVMVLGVQSLGMQDIEWPPLEGVQFRLMRGTPSGLRLKAQYLAFAVWAIYWCVRWRASFVYASDPLSAPVALVLQAFLRRKVLYHEHDAPSYRTTFGQRVVAWCRAWLTRRAILVVVPNADRASAFVGETGIAIDRVRCVWNCPAEGEARDPAPETEGDPFVVYFHGSINESRLPTTVLDAIATLPSCVQFAFAGYETLGSQGYVQRFIEHGRRAGLDRSRVRFLGVAGRRSAIMEWAGQSQVGLSLMPFGSPDINMRCMVGASNKPFDYMACGLALVVSRLPEWEEAFVRPGYAVACDPGDAQSIAAALRLLVDDPPARRAMARAAVARIRDDWNYEKQFQPVLEELERASAATP